MRAEREDLAPVQEDQTLLSVQLLQMVEALAQEVLQHREYLHLMARFA
jgi:hypothetical protein